jgi:hypothetical protein
MEKVHRGGRGITCLHLLFFCSGFPALIYQIVWQRALFAIYGLYTASVTIVVSGFKLGLGLGSLIGGMLSSNRYFAPVTLFAVAELFTGIFGIGSAQRSLAPGDAFLRHSNMRICEPGVGADYFFISPIAATRSKLMVPDMRQLTAVYWQRRIGRRRVRGKG